MCEFQTMQNKVAVAYLKRIYRCMLEKRADLRKLSLCVNGSPYGYEHARTPRTIQIATHP
jgi:hypothetical protein